MSFIGRDGGAVFVDLRLHPVHRVHNGGRGPRRACDLNEVKRDGRLRKPVPDSIPVPSAYEPGRENRDVEGPEGSGNVYTFAARERYALWRPVAVPERQVRDDEGPVHRGVKGDCQDHLDIPLFPEIIVSRPPGIYHTFSKGVSSWKLDASPCPAVPSSGRIISTFTRGSYKGTKAAKRAKRRRAMADEDRISRYQANLDDEQNSAYLYRVLADVESDERLS